ncbi:CorA family divalent cation transporter [Streptomyces naganishii]|uniref:CorA family divalent cation transporter n=1 Tax=Streptomyces naganishii TaxID=285447 RepID=UPI003682CCD7
MTEPPRASGWSGSGLDEAVAGVLFGQSPGGLHVYDTGLLLVRVNTAARHIREFPVDRMIGRSLLDVLKAFHAEDPAAVVDAARVVLETGNPELDLRFRVRNEQDPPRERVASVSLFRLQDSDGTAQGVAVTVADTAPDDGPGIARLLGLRTEGLPRFGRTDEPVRADFLGDRIGIVVPVVEGAGVAHVHVFATERHLVTVRRGPLQALDGFAARLAREGASDTAAVLFRLLQESLETFRRAAVRALLTTEDLEDRMFERRRPDQVYRLARLRRRAGLLHRALLPYLQVTDDVLTRRIMSGAFPEERRRLAREFQGAGRLVLADITSLQEATRRAFASYSSLVSGEQNGVINRLAIVSTIFLPLTFLTGYFGMNFTFLTDELESRAVFWLLAVGLQAGVLALAMYVLHRTQLWRRLRDDDRPEDH